jgi:hypothetical protein
LATESRDILYSIDISLGMLKHIPNTPESMPEKGNYLTLESITVPLSDFQGRGCILISAFRITTENHPYPCRFSDVVKENSLECAHV